MQLATKQYKHVLYLTLTASHACCRPSLGLTNGKSSTHATKMNLTNKLELAFLAEQIGLEHHQAYDAQESMQVIIDIST